MHKNVEGIKREGREIIDKNEDGKEREGSEIKKLKKDGQLIKKYFD